MTLAAPLPTHGGCVRECTPASGLRLLGDQYLLATREPRNPANSTITCMSLRLWWTMPHIATTGDMHPLLTADVHACYASVQSSLLLLLSWASHVHLTTNTIADIIGSCGGSSQNS